MSERPIVMSGESVRAILAGRKTQTRRVVHPQPGVPPEPGAYLDAYCGEPKTPKNPRGMGLLWHWWTADHRLGAEVARCPCGVPGDRLWVRERFWLERSGGVGGYAATCHPLGLEGSVGSWQPAYLMPRWASRITLDVEAVHVQRLQEISGRDVLAEGIDNGASNPSMGERWENMQRVAGAKAWDALNGRRASWASNPWVWAITFRRVP